MSRGRILSALLLIGFVGIFAGIYQFYFKERLAKYERDEQTKNQLDTLLKDIEDAFAQTDPEAVIQLWNLQQQPWNDELGERAAYFNFGDWLLHDDPPKEGVILRFWYDEESNKMIWDLYQRVRRQMGGRFDLFPPDIRTSLGVSTAADWAGIDLTEKDAHRELGRLAYGINQCDQLLQAKASMIREVSLWPVRNEKRYKNLLNIRTSGVDLSMTARDFVTYLEELMQAERYNSVDGFRIYYPYIGHQMEPQLQIELLVSRAAYKPRARGAGGVSLGAGGGLDSGGSLSARDAFMRMGGRRGLRGEGAEAKEPGVVGKAWKWFKRTVFYMN